MTPHTKKRTGLRCQVHKRRNVLEHLPERMRPSVRKAMQQAYDTEDAALAHRPERVNEFETPVV